MKVGTCQGEHNLFSWLTGLHFTGIFQRVWPPLEMTLVFRSMWCCCAAGASLELKALNQLPVIESLLSSVCVHIWVCMHDDKLVLLERVPLSRLY